MSVSLSLNRSLPPRSNQSDEIGVAPWAVEARRDKFSTAVTDYALCLLFCQFWR